MAAVKIKRLAVIVGAGVLVAAVGTGTVFAFGQPGNDGVVPPHLRQGTDKMVDMPGANTVPNSYIVVFTDTVAAQSVRATADDLAAAHGAKVKHTYESSLVGFSMTATPDQAAALAEDARVKYVEPDQRIGIAGS